MAQEPARADAEAGLAAPHEATRAPSRPPTSPPSPLERVITEAEPQTAKALLRLLIEELCVNSRREIQPTYRLVTPGSRNLRRVGGTRHSANLRRASTLTLD
jgi:hypothetical protein